MRNIITYHQRTPVCKLSVTDLALVLQILVFPDMLSQVVWLLEVRLAVGTGVLSQVVALGVLL